MIFSNESLQKLEKSVATRMSEKRFLHTLGVKSAAESIAGFIPELDKSELSAAALLHDIAKELSASDTMGIIAGMNGIIEADLICQSVHHSLVAPVLICRDFPEYKTKNILSAVKNHTTGAPDMSIFDEVIFLSDYIEEGRSYCKCTELREKLYSRLHSSKDSEEAIFHLHNATIECLENTIAHVLGAGGYLHERTVQTRNAFLARRPEPLNL